MLEQIISDINNALYGYIMMDMSADPEMKPDSRILSPEKVIGHFPEIFPEKIELVYMRVAGTV